MPLFSWFQRIFRSKTTVSAVVLSSLTLILIIGFQNCGKAGFDSAGDTQLQSINPADGVPFAFEAAADMITYNSCNSPSSQGKTFNYMIGAYDSKTTAGAVVGSTSYSPKGGVRIRQEFINYAAQVLKPDYPNPEVTAEQVQRLLAESSLNSKVLPQVSVRSIYKSLRLNNVFSKTSTPSLGIDVLPLLGNLANSTWSSLLVNKSFPKKSKIEYTDYFPEASSTQSRIEGAFYFNTNEQTAEDYRNAFNRVGNLDAQIVLGFSYENEGVLISPETSQNDIMTAAYGRGYRLSFANPSVAAIPSTWAGHPNNVVTKVEEYDLVENKQITDSVWDCGLRFNIVRQEDAHFDWNTVVLAVDKAIQMDSNIAPESKAAQKEAKILSMANYYGRVDGQNIAGFCPKMNYLTLMSVPPQNEIFGVGAYAGKTYAQILEMVRRHLPESDWEVNLVDRCVVPKKFSCYPETEPSGQSLEDYETYYGKYKVSNRINKACFHQFNNSYTSKANKRDDSGNLPTEWCNEFVTVCTKR